MPTPPIDTSRFPTGDPHDEFDAEERADQADLTERALDYVMSFRSAVPIAELVHPSKAASLITKILASLYQAEPAIFAVARASTQTQAEVALGLGLAQIIVGAFLKPAV